MFYEVRVLDSKNKLKKIVSGQQLSRKYWDKFESNFNISSPKKTKKKSATKSNQPIVHAKCKQGGEMFFLLQDYNHSIKAVALLGSGFADPLSQ